MTTAVAISHGDNTLRLGQTFESWLDLQRVITDYGTQQERVIVTIYKDPARYCGKCRMRAWAESQQLQMVCESEWDWFLTLLREAIPNLCEFGTMFLSNREKGLLTSVDDIFRAGHHVFCVWHIKLNMRTLGFSKEICKMFDGLVWAATPEQFEARLECIQAKNQEAADYIRNTADPIHYSRAFIPFRRWGKESSQQAESQNKVLKPERSVPALQSSCMLWDYMMRTYHEKKQLAQNCDTPFAPNIMLELKDIELRAYKFIAQTGFGAADEVKITDDSGRQLRVELVPEWKCTCGDFQDKLMPCVHAWRALTTLKKVHHDYVDGSYSTTTFRETYSKGLPVLLKDDLVRNPHCGPPLKVRKTGWPSEKSRLRFQEDQTEQAVRRCRVCAKPGHDKQNCPQWKGRRQGVADVHANEQSTNSSTDDKDSYSGGEDNAFMENINPNLPESSQASMSCMYQMSMTIPCSQFNAEEPFSYPVLLASCSTPTRKT